METRLCGGNELVKTELHPPTLLFLPSLLLGLWERPIPCDSRFAAVFQAIVMKILAFCGGASNCEVRTLLGQIILSGNADRYSRPSECRFVSHHAALALQFWSEH